jgi:hypothetical protein
VPGALPKAPTSVDGQVVVFIMCIPKKLLGTGLVGVAAGRKLTLSIIAANAKEILEKAYILGNK